MPDHCIGLKTKRDPLIAGFPIIMVISLNASAISRASEILFLSHDDQQTPLDSINREVLAERPSARERLRDQLSLVIIVRLFWGVPGYL